MNKKVKKSLHPPGASLHRTPHCSPMNSAILGSLNCTFPWVKAICTCAFTLTILGNNHLQPSGEEVKAKIGKHWTRGRARLGENAMVFVRKRGAEKDGHPLRFFELCTKCTRHTAARREVHLPIALRRVSSSMDSAKMRQKGSSRTKKS